MPDEFISPKMARNIARYKKNAFYNLLKPTKKRPPVIPAIPIDVPGSPIQYRIKLSDIKTFLRNDIDRNKKDIEKLKKKVIEQEHKLTELDKRLYS